MSRLVVTDTSCLIALSRVGLLDLLPRLYEEVIAPTAVLVEFGSRPTWLREEAVRDRMAVDQLRARHLDPGESEALVLAKSLPGAIRLIDEARGRKVALSMELSIVGTAGLLLAAKRGGLIHALKPVWDVLIQEHRFRLAERHYLHVLYEADEV